MQTYVPLCVFQFIKTEQSVVACRDFCGLDMKIEDSRQKSVIRCKELSTSENFAVLEDDPTSAYENMVSFLILTIVTTISCFSDAALASHAKSLQFLTF